MTEQGEFVIAKEETAVVPRKKSMTPMDLIELAVSQQCDITKLEKLLEMQSSWEKNEAKKAFVTAMNAFKSDVPSIIKNKHVNYATKGGTVVDYDHATIDQVCDSLIPALSKYGLYHHWRVSQVDGKIRVTCILTHSLGHSEETTMEAPPDDSGGKNSIQAIAAANTYLQRYTFLAATGTAAKGTDTDAVTMTPELENCLVAIRESPDLSALKKVSAGAIADYMRAKDFPGALVLIEARDKRKREIESEAA